MLVTSTFLTLCQFPSPRVRPYGYPNREEHKLQMLHCSPSSGSHLNSNLQKAELIRQNPSLEKVATEQPGDTAPEMA